MVTPIDVVVLKCRKGLKRVMYERYEYGPYYNSLARLIRGRRA